jgi:putative Holliday junction resolvase
MTGRVLALDHGSARCGCALSDPSGTLATPIGAVARPDEESGLDALVALVTEREVDRVVVGLPLTLSGEEGEQARAARAFADALRERVGVPVELHDERLTTRMAERSGGPTPERRPGVGRPSTAARPGSDSDSRAAAHLLEGWLAAQGQRA